MLKLIAPLPALGVLCAPRCELEVKGLVAAWDWLLAPSDVPIMVTALGDLFVARMSGAVGFLDVASATLVEVSPTEATFHAVLLDPDNVQECFAPDVVHALVGRHGALRAGECFSCVVPLTLAGTLTPDNFARLDVMAHFRALGSIQRQVAHLPIGAVVTSVQLGN